jgi:hypothetical protein
MGSSDEAFHLMAASHSSLPLEYAMAASSARCNLGVIHLLRDRGSASQQRAHRLFTSALLLDPTNDAAATNLELIGGRSACADITDHEEPGQDAQCEEIPGYHARMVIE